MNIGELQHRVLVEKESLSSDGQGGYDSTWTTLGSVWAAVNEKPRTAHSAEKYARGETTHTQKIILTIRQNQSFTVPGTRESDKLRLTHRSQYFKVIGISRSEYGQDFYDILAEIWGATTS